MWRALLALIPACGPGLAHPEPNRRAIARDALTSATDADALEKLMRGDLMNGGLWFADPDCAKQFPSAGPVAPEKFHALATCLAALHFQASSRVDELPDVAILTYAPGMEIEARVLDEHDGPRLTWIGYEARRDDADALPTISHDTLEALRTAGDRNAGIDATTAAELHDLKDGSCFAWLKVCLGTDGGVTSVQAREGTSLLAASAAVDGTHDWKFNPFTVNGEALPVCAMVHIAYPPKQAPEVVPTPFAGGTLRLAPQAIEVHRIAGSKLIVPDDRAKTVLGHTNIDRLVGTFKLCLTPEGRVAAVVPLRSTGVASYDRKIIQEIMTTWQYSPFLDHGNPVAVCTAVTFVYSQR
jgi:hypothetical protein